VVAFIIPYRRRFVISFFIRSCKFYENWAGARYAAKRAIDDCTYRVCRSCTVHLPPFLREVAFAKQKTEGERCDRRLWRRQGNGASGSGRNSVSELRTKNFWHRNRKALPTKPHCQESPSHFAMQNDSPLSKGAFSYCTAAKRLPLKFQGGTFASAACGRAREQSEWQRSKFCERIANKEFRAPQQELSASRPTEGI